ncbi:translation elongation factor Ts [Alphaproteobacteria bacterium]|nr:translation elongation factor Ts [Alphaproteobacteria bacterium]
MTVTAALVKELRARSGAGMMDCKKALAETSGDLDGAVDWLRTKGLAAAAKKSGRAAAEGLIGASISADGLTGRLVEVNSETDFVSRNEQFQKYVEDVADLTDTADMDALKGKNYPGSERNVGDELTHLISVIGENMNLRRAAHVAVKQGVVSAYVHNVARDGLGKIGVLVALESAGDQAILGKAAKQIAMHVAASKPLALSREDLDPQVIERERAVLIEQAQSSGKPKEIAEKMVEGRLRKYYEEVVLLEQVFIMDTDKKIADVVADAAKEANADVALTHYASFILGEGVEKKEEDFAAEVAATRGGV